MSSFNNKDFNEQFKNVNYLLNPCVEYDPINKKYFVAHRYYTKYFDTKQEAFDELCMCSVIGEPVNFSNTYSNELNKVNQNKKLNYTKNCNYFLL